MEPGKRDELVLHIRPKLTLQEGTTEEEHFQNIVLRPILKFQNELLLSIARDYLQRHRSHFNLLKRSAQETVIHQAARQDPELRNGFIYPIVSLLSIEELAFYQQHRSELNKRIVQMAIQRVQSQLERLY